MTDQYDTLLRALEPGVILTVNDNDPTTYGWAEMVVERSAEDTTLVDLSDGRKTYQITRDGDRLVIGEGTEWGLKETKEVTTIEIWGIEGGSNE